MQESPRTDVAPAARNVRPPGQHVASSQSHGDPSPVTTEAHDAINRRGTCPWRAFEKILCLGSVSAPGDFEAFRIGVGWEAALHIHETSISHTDHHHDVKVLLLGVSSVSSTVVC